MSDVSAVLIVHNEADKIAACLDTLLWAHESVVVDLQSTDETASIAALHGAKVTTHDWVPYCEPVRNFAVALANSAWVLLIDPDEHVSPELAMTIQRIFTEDWPYDVVMIPRINVVFGEVMLHADAVFSGAVESLPRLFRKGFLSWPPEIHRLPLLNGLRVTCLDADRDGAMLHLSRPSVDETLKRLGRYTGIEAADLLNSGIHYSTLAAFISSVRYFMAVYFKQKTYRNGVPGLFWALESGIYRLLVWMQLWDKEGQLPMHDGPITRWGTRAAFVVTAISATASMPGKLRRQLARVQPTRQSPPDIHSS